MNKINGLRGGEGSTEGPSPPPSTLRTSLHCPHAPLTSRHRGDFQRRTVRRLEKAAPCFRPYLPFARPSLRLPKRRWSLRRAGSFSRLTGQNRPESGRLRVYLSDSAVISVGCGSEAQFPVLSRNRRFRRDNRPCSVLLSGYFDRITGRGSLDCQRDVDRRSESGFRDALHSCR